MVIFKIEHGEQPCRFQWSLQTRQLNGANSVSERFSQLIDFTNVISVNHFKRFAMYKLKRCAWCVSVGILNETEAVGHERSGG